jgi:hypothetical protein
MISTLLANQSKRSNEGAKTRVLSYPPVKEQVARRKKIGSEKVSFY